MTPVDPFGSAARRYWDLGWHGTLHLPWRAKKNPPAGFTGPGAPYLSRADVSGLIHEFGEAQALHNIGLRMPDGPAKLAPGQRDTAIAVSGKRFGLIGIDVDAYKHGGETLAELVRQLGELPATWRSSARWASGDHASGIAYYRVPVGRTWKSKLGDSIEVIQQGHRYSVVWPSLHDGPEHHEYQWISPAATITSDLPSPAVFPLLPEVWQEYMAAPSRVTAVELDLRETRGWLAACLEPDAKRVACRIIRATCAKYVRELSSGSGSRHDTALAALRALVAMGGEGHRGAPTAVRELGAAFMAALMSGAGGGRVLDERDARFELHSMIYGAIRIAAARNAQPRSGCACSTWDDIPGASPQKPGGPTHATFVGPPGSAPASALGDGDALEGATIAEPLAEPVEPLAERPEETDFTDARLAEVIAASVLAGRYVWTSAAGWLRWDGRRWVEASDVQARETVRQWALDQFVRAVKDGATAERRKALSRICGADKIGALTSLARGLMLRDYALFDADPDLLNCPNGVVDLPTGRLMRHNPSRLITKITKASYVAEATHRDWTAALGALPSDVQPYMQVRLGQAITGHMTSDDKLIINQGGGENGKGTIFGVITFGLGDYFCLVSDSVLLGNPDQHTTDIMDLKGARLALVEETPEARRLGVSRLKKLVGTPYITARRIRCDPVTFPATHSTFVNTNYELVVDETDHGTWRRLALVRFPYTYTDDPVKLAMAGYRKRDPGLRDRLIRDAHEDGPRARAALAWLVTGAQEWYRAGRDFPAPPGQIIADTLTWRSGTDPIMAYIAERLDFDLDAFVPAADLLADFNDWLRDHGAHKWGDKVFTSRFGGHDSVTLHSVGKGRRYRTEAGLSRTPNVTGEWIVESASINFKRELPARFHAWAGIRFRQPDSDTGGPGKRSEPDKSNQGNEYQQLSVDF